jgi:hypothetical protein
VHKRKCTLNKAQLKACKRGAVSAGMIIYIFTRPCGALRAAIVAASTQETATMLATMGSPGSGGQQGRFWNNSRFHTEQNRVFNERLIPESKVFQAVAHWSKVRGCDWRYVGCWSTLTASRCDPSEVFLQLELRCVSSTCGLARSRRSAVRLTQ